MIPFIDLQTQRSKIEENVNIAINNVLKHGQYVMGPEVAKLEKQLAEYTGAKHVISCANGTDALVLALKAKGVSEGDAVFAPSFTFVATVEAIKLIGATPVFIDVDKQSFNICCESLKAAIFQVKSENTFKPSAIIAVDLFGQPADYNSLKSIAEEEGLFLIADAAQSFGATQNSIKVGSMGHVATTSFFPAKPLGCYGDGGALFTNDDELAFLLKSIRNHGQGTDRYDNVRVGVNSRLDTLQAAILLEKLNIFDDEIIARNQVAERYHSNLSDIFLKQKLLVNTTSVWAQYTIVHENRDEIREKLGNQEIPTAVYYPKPNHLQAPYVNDPRAPNGLPNTEFLQDRVFSLPMHPYLEVETQDQIIEAVNRCV